MVGLAIYGLIFFALIKLIPITLTLPGIAGLILTIGVAADANIVIFERIKEEARAGKSMLSAIAVGYRRGIATIIDANVITLITAFILFALATANVKGFAFTLGVGTIASLFTAVVFTQAFLGLFGRARFMRSPAALGAHTEQRVRWHFDFSRASKYFFTLSGCILLVGALSFATKQLNLGIDFEGGSRITVGLQKAATVDDVRSTVEAAGINDSEITKASNKELGTNVFEIDSKASPEAVQSVQPALQSKYGIVPNGFNATTVGPTFGQQVAKSAIYAIIFSLLVICGYVAFRFEPKYAVPVIIAVIHDILITGGVYSLTGREVTSGTVAAFLTILGYSLYDTVIVFDRIRENVPRLPRATFSQIVNRSMSEVLTRSLITGTVERLPGDGAVHLRRRDVEGLRLRDDDRAAVGYVLVDLHRLAGAHALEGARAGLPPPPRAHRGADGPRAGVPGGKRGRANRGRSRGADPGRDAGARRPCPEPLAGPGRRSGTARTRPTAARRPSRPSRRRPSARHGTAGPTAVTVLPSGDGAADGGGDGGRGRPSSASARSSARRAPQRCGGCGSSSPEAAGRSGARSTGGTADGRAGLVHDGRRDLALHGLRP